MLCYPEGKLDIINKLHLLLQHNRNILIITSKKKNPTKQINKTIDLTSGKNGVKSYQNNSPSQNDYKMRIYNKKISNLKKLCWKGALYK